MIRYHDNFRTMSVDTAASDNVKMCLTAGKSSGPVWLVVRGSDPDIGTTAWRSEFPIVRDPQRLRDIADAFVEMADAIEVRR